MNPRISIITVNYNGYALTCALIDSLQRHVTGPLEIIVVDNGSTNDEAALLRARYPGVKVLRSEENLGFAGGNNLGLRAAAGEYLLLLNNDTEVEEDTLHLLCETMEAHPEAGAVCPKIRFFYPPRAVQFAGYTPLSRITLRNALIGFNRPDDGRYDRPAETPYAHGAAMMVRREALARVGEMPESYFLYYEELDWSERIREAGFTIRYDPRCTVFHKESATTGQRSPLRSYYLMRNRLLYARRNRRGAVRLLSLLYQTAVALPKALLTAALRGTRGEVQAIACGAWDFYRGKTGKR